MEDFALQKSLKLLRKLSEGTWGVQLELETSKGLRLIEARKGFVLCSFIVPSNVSDGNGNWHPGAIATLIDNVGAFATYSLSASAFVSVDFTISYFSTAKVQEEVELEARVIGENEKLVSVVVKVRKKENGEMIALGKQWMASVNPSNKVSPKWMESPNPNSNARHQTSKL